MSPAQPVVRRPLSHLQPGSSLTFLHHTMSRLRWSDEDSLGGSLAGRERYRYTPRHSETLDQGHRERDMSGSSSHLSAGWRTLSSDSGRQGRSYRSSRDLSPRQEYRQEYCSSRRQINRYPDRDFLHDHQPHTNRSFTDFHTSHRSSADLHSSSSHRSSSDIHSILVKGTQSQPFQSFTGSSTNLHGHSRSFSQGYLEVQEGSSPSHHLTSDRGRLRTQGLSFGVSEADLERATR